MRLARSCCSWKFVSMVWSSVRSRFWRVCTLLPLWVFFNHSTLTRRRCRSSSASNSLESMEVSDLRMWSSEDWPSCVVQVGVGGERRAFWCCASGCCRWFECEGQGGTRSGGASRCYSRMLPSQVILVLAE